MKTLCRAAVMAAFALTCTIANAQSTQLSTQDAQYVVQQARDLQFNLRSAGVERLRCQATPDWDSFFRQLGIDTTSETSIVPLLKRTHFLVEVTSDGAVAVSHTGVPSPNAGTAASMRAAVGGMENMIAGFFKNWSMYAFASPLPQMTSNYQLAIADDGYALSYQRGATLVHTAIDAGFAVRELKYDSSGFNMVLHPAWAPERFGYLLTGYDAETKTEAGTAHSTVEVAYREVDGIRLPAIMKQVSAAPNGNVEVNFTFENYEVKKADARREVASGNSTLDARGCMH